MIDEIDSRDCTLLFVDDEQYILNSLRRLFRADGYKIRLAASGAEGLDILASEPVDLIVSDMRMPEMNGAEFLARAAERRPDVPRILLTGYADMQSTIEAVNRGRIYCYVSKPWEEQDLRYSVRNALQSRLLRRQRDELLEVTRKQNAELKDLNANLEERVRQRTAEAEQTAEMYELAFADMKHAYLQAIPVFVGLVELQEGDRKGYSTHIAELVRETAKSMGLEEEQVEQAYHGALLHMVGRIGLPPEVLNRPYAELSDRRRSLFETYPARGQAAITALEPLAPAATIIRHHRELHDGSGYPDRLSGEDIPLGARILGLAVDYAELQSGVLKSQTYSERDARDFIHANIGKRYDREAASAFLSVAARMNGGGSDELQLPLAEVRPGMVLRKDLVTSDGILLLTKGHRLNETLIRRLEKLEQEGGKRFVLTVHPV